MDLAKSISRRRLLEGTAAVGAVAAADTLLTRPARASRAKDVVTLSFWTNPANTEEDPEFLQVVKNFEATHPNIKIKYTPIASGNFDTTLITTHAVSGTLPDVFFNRTFQTAFRANRGWTLNLNPYIQRDKLSLRDFWPSELAQEMWKGQLHSLPYDWSDLAIYYNKTLFDKKKMPYPPTNGAWTWDEMLAMAKEFVDTSGGKQQTWGLDLGPFFWGNWPIDGWLIAWGATWGGKDLRTFHVNTPEVTKLFQTLQDLTFKQNVIPKAGSIQGGVDAFSSGRVAMGLSGCWAPQAYRPYIGKRFEYDVAPVPKSPLGIRPVAPAGGAWSIAATSKHPEEAWEWIKFLTNTQSAEILISKPARGIPGRQSAVLPWMKTVAAQPPAHWSIFIDQMRTALKVPSYPYYNDLGTITGNVVSGMLSANGSVPQLLATWEANGQAATRKYQF